MTDKQFTNSIGKVADRFSDNAAVIMTCVGLLCAFLGALAL